MKFNKIKIIKKYITDMKDLYGHSNLIKFENIVIFIFQWNFLSENCEKLEKYLTKKQKEKLKKYIMLEDKYNYISTHAVVNIIFYEIYGELITDDKLGFDNGKPYIKKNEKFKYSISHTKKCAVVAFSKKEIGIDIENYKKKFNYNKILEKYFTYEKEKYRLIDLKKFYTLWTIKESCLKFSKNGIKNLEKIIVIKMNHKAAVVEDTFRNKFLNVNIIYSDNKFVISLCYKKNKSFYRKEK